MGTAGGGGGAMMDAAPGVGNPAPRPNGPAGAEPAIPEMLPVEGAIADTEGAGEGIAADGREAMRPTDDRTDADGARPSCIGADGPREATSAR